MATLVLQVAGGAMGAAVAGPAGAIAGRALGALAGSAVDSSLLSALDGRKATAAPALTDVPGLTSTEGAPIPKVYGRARIGGQLIWATRIERVASFSSARSGAGGKGALSDAGSGADQTWSYFANLAVGLCEGPIAFVRRVWADGDELDLATLTMRVHAGAADQQADPLIVAKEGPSDAPAYRGLAYVVFERLPLADFGNRIPQFSFEVVRPVNGLCAMIRAVDLIPGSTEYGYDPLWRVQTPAEGVSAPENRHQLHGPTDIAASLDALQALCPNLQRVALVVSWFGDDLRAGDCSIAPRVERHDKPATGDPWMVSGEARALTRPVSLIDGRPAYGGTPSDAAVIRIIQELAARGLAVTLYPFVMMDIAPGNGRADPRNPGSEQAPFPWRGRMTCHPGPDVAGTPDGSAAAAAQVARFFGDAAPGEFTPYFATVVFSGAPQWSYRRFILHYAALAALAGGVEAFVIGSEFVGLTRVRGAAGYPAAEQFAALAGDARAVLGAGCKLVYAADWTEYGAHVRNGGADVDFPLDVVWASPHIDAVGVDYYPPFSDWRDGAGHADAGLAGSVYDLDYLTGQLGAGEAFDWYYASGSDRAAQVRSPIVDGAWGKPWIYRAKDLVGWWSNPHLRRAGGVEIGPTVWVPAGKPIWLTEIGVPAVDKGTNGPNVFPDPKSSENAAPPFSLGFRDDLMQMRGVQAIIRRFDPAFGANDGWNPVSPLYGGRMVDPSRIYVWAWDARPFPAFPAMSGVWGDAANWGCGHWLTGRLEGVEVAALLRQMLLDFSVGDPDAPVGAVEVDGYLDGYVVDRPMSAREALQPLCDLYGCQAAVSGGTVRFCGPSGAISAWFTADDLVPDDDGAPWLLTRAQESELPREARIGFTDGDGDYRRAAATSHRLAGFSQRAAAADVPAVTHRGAAQRLADIWLQRLWQARDHISLRISPRSLALEPGDVIAVAIDGLWRTWRITRIVDGACRALEAEAIALTLPDGAGAPWRPAARPSPPLPGPPLALALDLPAALAQPEPLQYLAAFADPWPGTLAVWRSADGGHFDHVGQIAAPAMAGRTTTPLPPGPLWRFDHVNAFTAVIRGGAIASVDDAALFDGANLFALLDDSGLAEILAAGRVELVGEADQGGRMWRFSRLLRGLGGSESTSARLLPPGARIVALDRALTPLTSDLNDLGRTMRYRVGPAGHDHGDGAFQELVAAPSALALRPLAPVHIRARRGPEGVLIRFLRRSRLLADAWGETEPPLGEAFERYDIDIHVGDGVKRTLSGDAPAILYPAAAELADFGAAQATLDLAVMQISAVAGRGFPARAIVTIS